MKKTYNKPFIMVELFQLDAALASSCSVALHHGEHTCNDTDKDGEAGTGYFGAACVHDVTVPDGDGNDTICYHGPITDIATLYMNS